MTPHNVIMFCGQRYSGKTVTAHSTAMLARVHGVTVVELALSDLIRNEIWELNSVRDHTYVQLCEIADKYPRSWAPKLLDCIDYLFGRRRIEAKRMLWNKTPDREGKVRLAMQLYATEYRRKLFGEDYWGVKVVDAIYNLESKAGLVVVEGTRMDEEYCYVRERLPSILVDISTSMLKPGVDIDWSLMTHESDYHYFKLRAMANWRIHNLAGLQEWYDNVRWYSQHQWCKGVSAPNAVETVLLRGAYE